MATTSTARFATTVATTAIITTVAPTAATITAATVAAVTSHHLIFFAHHGETDDRKRDRNSNGKNTIHAKLLKYV